MANSKSLLQNSEAEVSTKDNEITGKEREYRDFIWRQEHLLDWSYADLEEKNLEIKKSRGKGISNESFKEKFLEYLKKEKGIKAVTVCFSDLEGSFHALDYDKKHLISSEDNLTFDGSSIKGFTVQRESDLRLKLDWSSYRWLPSDIFGPGKVMLFANVCNQDGSLYISDFRARLFKYCDELFEKGITVNIAPEVEGFLFKGLKAEQNFDEKIGFELATLSGYFSSLPQDTLRLFIDKFAEAQRALGFENEKDHPEVAPAQFELNYKYCGALDASDQIQLYKLLARQVANYKGLTASFLPKPIQGLNGSGMHTNISLSKDKKNMFFDKNGENNLSDFCQKFITGILYYANDLCLIMNPSVNAYRRLDPHFEAPNEIRVSAVDRGAMVRIPIGNEKSARIEVRTVAPDANPYLCVYSLLKAGFKGVEATEAEFKKMEKSLYSEDCKKLPGDIYQALDYFKNSKFMVEIMGERSHKRFAELKEAAAERCPRALGTRIKSGEVLYHHEVTNQLLWSWF